MTGPADRWVALEALFQEALARPAEARIAYLESACPDADARSEVEALLSAHERRGRLDDLADQVMTPLLTRPEIPVQPPEAPAMHPRYRVMERLGGGGMGVVYRARDERLSRDVALKFLPPHLSADKAAKKRFLVEARAAAALEHPNICTVHEIGDTDDGQLYIVMACYEGETLDRRIARGPLAVGDALHVAVEITRGLVQAHERGIVHRDIKPANVMITSDGLVKILDFGIAKLADANQTQAHSAAGTVAYMSPEQAFGEGVDHRSDIWSLGVVLYEMLSGSRPFGGPAEQAILFAALTTDPEPITNLRANVPVEADALLHRALQKSPDDRFASASEMAAALESCMARASSTAGQRGRTPALGGGGTRTEVAPRNPALTRGGERRHVTVVECRLAGHDGLLELLPPEQAEEVLSRVKEAATAVASQHGGILNQFSGDGIVMVFGAAAAREDDAVRGVRAALVLHARVAGIAGTLDGRLAGELRLRSGVHVGAVVAQRLREGGRRFRITGAATDVAGRLAAAAASDSILVSPETRRLVAPFMFTEEARAVSLHADSAPVVPHRVLGESNARSRLESAAGTGLTPFVGRERERAELAEHLASACRGMGRFTVLVGEAGAGKSRLLHELRKRAAGTGARVLTGRCDAYGGTTPFLPFIEAVHDALGVVSSDAAQERHDAVVKSLRSIDESLDEFLPLYLALLGIASREHAVPAGLQGERLQAAMLDAIAALFTLGARDTPSVVLLEDWHWADVGSRVALRRLAEIVPACPILVVVTSRPDSAEDWGSADHQSLLHLSPLDVAASAAIACAVLGAGRMAPDLAERLHDRTGGNPFFLEELCEALREEGSVFVRDGEAAASGATGTVHVPETVQGVLRTRIDRLDDSALDALRVASVIGREFSRGVLGDVAVPGGGLASALETLKASGLVQQVGVLPEPAYRFKHALTQEVAYDSLLLHQRATLHLAVGRAIEQRYASQLDGHVERLAHHFSRAGEWSSAVDYGLRAADRAMGLSQNVDALSTLERVESWVASLPDDLTRRDLQADVLLRQERLCEMLGLRSRQLALVEALTALLAPFGPSERLAKVYLRQGDAYTLLHRFEAAERSLETALRIAGERDDEAGARNALRSIALLRTHEGRHEEALAKIERVIELGREAGDTRAEAGDIATLANILRGMGQPGRALDVLEAALERTTAADNPVQYDALLGTIGTLHGELGNDEKALEYFRRVASEGMQQRHSAIGSFTVPFIAHILLGQGRIEEALETYGQAIDMNRKARYADGLARACRSLGEVLVGLDRHEAALPHLREAAALFVQLEDGVNEALMWRRIAAVHERLLAPGDAREAWTRVRELHRRMADVAGEAEAVEGMARAEREMHEEPEGVVARYEEALALALRLGDRKRELSVRNALGIVHWQRGAYGEAVRHYEVALRLCREDGDRVHEALILNSLGATLHRLQRWDEARTALSAGERAAAATGETRLRAHSLATLGEVCLASGRLGEACSSVEASLALRHQLDDRRGEGWMLERLARVYSAQGADDASRRAADSSLAIADEINDNKLREAVQHFRDSAGETHTSNL